MSNISFRPCLPSDAIKAAPLIISSGPDAFRYIFAVDSLEDVERFVTYAFKQGEGELGYENHIAVIQNDTLVAVGAIWSSKDMLRFTLQGMRQIIHFYGLWRGVMVIRRALQLESVVQPPKQAIAYLGHFGVEPSARGLGIGTQLIEYLVKEGVGRGFDVFGLDVSAENPRAQQLYERMGFVVRQSNTGGSKNHFGRVHTHYYMEKSVN